MLFNYGKRRKRLFIALAFKNGFALYRRLKFFDSLFSKVLICSIQVRCSSTKIPRELIEDDRFIS